MKKMIDNIRKYLPVVFLFVLLFFCIRYRKDLSVERILSYTPEEPVKAALLMLVFYAVKSVSFVFPIAVLQLAVGHLFSTGTALLVNFLGRAVTLAIPYWMGRFSGCFHGGESYFQISEAENSGGLPERKLPLYISFFMRTLNFLPGRCSESVSGCGEDPIWNIYGWAAMLGTLPGVILATIFGANIKNPGVSGILALRGTSCDDQCILDPDT